MRFWKARSQKVLVITFFLILTVNLLFNFFNMDRKGYVETKNYYGLNRIEIGTKVDISVPPPIALLDILCNDSFYSDSSINYTTLEIDSQYSSDRKAWFLTGYSGGKTYYNKMVFNYTDTIFISVNINSTGNNAGIMLYNSTGTYWVFAYGIYSGNGYYFIRYPSGGGSNILNFTSGTRTPNINYNYKLYVDFSSGEIYGFINNICVLKYTDTSIKGNLYAGFWMDGIYNYNYYDDFYVYNASFFSYNQSIIVQNLTMNYKVKLYVDNILIAQATADSEGIANIILPYSYLFDPFAATLKVYDSGNNFLSQKSFADLKGGDVFSYEIKLFDWLEDSLMPEYFRITTTSGTVIHHADTLSALQGSNTNYLFYYFNKTLLNPYDTWIIYNDGTNNFGGWLGNRIEMCMTKNSWIQYQKNYLIHTDNCVVYLESIQFLYNDTMFCVYNFRQISGSPGTITARILKYFSLQASLGKYVTNVKFYQDKDMFLFNSTDNAIPSFAFGIMENCGEIYNYACSNNTRVDLSVNGSISNSSGMTNNSVYANVNVGLSYSDSEIPEESDHYIVFIATGGFDDDSVEAKYDWARSQNILDIIESKMHQDELWLNTGNVLSIENETAGLFLNQSLLCANNFVMPFTANSKMYCYPYAESASPYHEFYLADTFQNWATLLLDSYKYERVYEAINYVQDIYGYAIGGHHENDLTIYLPVIYQFWKQNGTLLISSLNVSSIADNFYNDFYDSAKALFEISIYDTQAQFWESDSPSNYQYWMNCWALTAYNMAVDIMQNYGNNTGANYFSSVISNVQDGLSGFWNGTNYNSFAYTLDHDWWDIWSAGSYTVGYAYGYNYSDFFFCKQLKLYWYYVLPAPCNKPSGDVDTGDQQCNIYPNSAGLVISSLLTLGDYNYSKTFLDAMLYATYPTFRLDGESLPQDVPNPGESANWDLFSFAFAVPRSLYYMVQNKSSEISVCPLYNFTQKLADDTRLVVTIYGEDKLPVTRYTINGTSYYTDKSHLIKFNYVSGKTYIINAYRADIPVIVDETVNRIMYNRTESYSENTQTLSIEFLDGIPASTSIIEIYSKNNLTTITGGLLSNYDYDTNIATIYVTSTTVIVSWANPVIHVGGPYGYTWNPFDLFSQYLRMGNLVGFISATYTSIMGEAWYGFVILIFAIPIYFRTESLFYVCMVLLLGSGFFVYLLPPAAWHIAVVFMVLGVAGILYRIFTRERD